MWLFVGLMLLFLLLFVLPGVVVRRRLVRRRHGHVATMEGGGSHLTPHGRQRLP